MSALAKSRDTTDGAAAAAEQGPPVWLTYYEPSGGRHKGIYATPELAKRACEAAVQGWIADSPWDAADGPPPVLHAVTWTWEPDPGLPEVFHPQVPEDKYVWVGRYCAEQPTWLLKVVGERVVTPGLSTGGMMPDAEKDRCGCYTPRECERLGHSTEKDALPAEYAASPGREIQVAYSNGDEYPDEVWHADALDILQGPAVTRLLNEVRAQAWDEGHRFTGYEPSPGENPYRTLPAGRSHA